MHIIIFLECKDLIRNMLRIRPLKRLTVCEILNHPWMRSEKFEMSSNSEVNVIFLLLIIFILFTKTLK